MILKENTTSQKLRGAYYTPLLLAEKIAEYFKGDASIKSVLEPSCGGGVLVGLFEIEPALCKTARKIWKKLQARRLGRG